MKVGVIGGGSWGATLAQALSDNGHDVLIRDIVAERVDGINQTHKHPFFDVTLPENIHATLDLKEACDFSDILLLSVPTVAMRTVLQEMVPFLTEAKLFINVSKGIEPDTLLTMSQVVADVVPDHFIKGFVTLSGPSHAEELIERKLTVLVSASKDEEIAKIVQLLFTNDKYLRVYTSTDIIGVEVGGSVKNAIALVSGIASGLGLGENARAALISRGALEIIAIADVLGGKRETVYGLTGIGDLIVTASSLNSRNFQAGLKIGRGESMDQVVKNSKMAVEGVRTVISSYEIAVKYNLDLPIIQMTYALLYEGADVHDVIPQLLNRKLKAE